MHSQWRQFSQMSSSGSGGHWWVLTEAGHSPPQTVSLLINTNDIMCWEDGEKYAWGSPSLARPAPRSMCEDHLHLTVVLSLQLEFNISMRSMHLFEVDGKKLTIVINKEHIWWPGAVCLAVHSTAELGSVRLVATWPKHVHLCAIVFSEEAANVSLGRPQGEIKPHNK